MSVRDDAVVLKDMLDHDRQDVIDYDLLWATVTGDLPELIAVLERIVE